MKVEPIIKVSELSHRYKVQWAVKDIELELQPNRIYGLLGANGAGKSTIMNIMCGVLKQTEGKVTIQGISLETDPVKAKRHIGFLPQYPPLLPELTVEEFLIHSANIRLMDSGLVKKAVRDVMEKCQISHFSKRVIKNLSGGYQQRVGIAQAIIHKPDLVVLDEPTNGLDPNQILEVRHLIRQIALEHTVILSTHILQEVQALCDNIWMINQGRMVFSGTIQEFDSNVLPSSLIVKFNSSPGIQALEMVNGVIRVEEVEDRTYRVHFGEGQPVTEGIVVTSVEKDWRLTEITIEKRSLETIFAELTKIEVT